MALRHAATLSLAVLGSHFTPSRGQASPTAFATPRCSLCPSGFTLLTSTGKCLQVATGAFTQPAAITACAALAPGGTLWTIDSSAEFAWVQATITGTQELWTGLYKTSCTPNLAADLNSPNCAASCGAPASGRYCAWQWVDGSAFGAPLNTPATANPMWISTEPNTAPPVCVRVSGSQSKLLADTACTTSYNSYACEVPLRSCSPAPSASPTLSGSRTSAASLSSSASMPGGSSSPAVSRSAVPSESPCAGGYYCAVRGAPAVQCPAGWFCPVGSTAWNGYACGRGNYCPAGSAAPLSCGVKGAVDATLGPANGAGSRLMRRRR